MPQSSDVRILKNTVIIYIRMAVTIIVGLVTSRLFLQALGNRDCRVDVSCSPAAGENKFHFTILKKDGSAIRGLPRRAKHR